MFYLEIIIFGRNVKTIELYALIGFFIKKMVGKYIDIRKQFNTALAN